MSKRNEYEVLCKRSVKVLCFRWKSIKNLYCLGQSKTVKYDKCVLYIAYMPHLNTPVNVSEHSFLHLFFLL